MVVYLPRSAWKARPSRGPRSLVGSRVDGTVFHWPGMSKAIHTEAGVASALRGWQNYHMDDRGWSDIAYQIAIDQTGTVWTLRGLNIQSGANGNEDVNERFGAFLLVLAPGEQPSMAMRRSGQAVVADFRRRFPSGLFVGCHSDVRPAGTDCPGPLARAAIRRGEFTPGATAPPTEDDEMSQAQVDAIMERIDLLKEEVNNFSRSQDATNDVADAKRNEELDATLATLKEALANFIRSVDSFNDLDVAKLKESVDAIGGRVEQIAQSVDGLKQDPS